MLFHVVQQMASQQSILLEGLMGVMEGCRYGGRAWLWWGVMGRCGDGRQSCLVRRRSRLELLNGLGHGVVGCEGVWALVYCR